MSVDPLTLALIGTAVSGAVSAVGAIQAGQAQEAQADYDRQIAERNATLAEQDRVAKIRNSQIEAEDNNRNNRRKLAKIRAAYGNSGIEFSGTPLQVLTDSSIELALDSRRIEHQGEEEARQDTLRIQGFREEADLASVRGQNASASGFLNATSAVVGAASSAASLNAQVER